MSAIDANTTPHNELRTIPGEQGLPLLGKTLDLLNDPIGLGAYMSSKYGNVYWMNSFGRKTVTLLGPEANEFVLMDKGKNFSSEKGWAAYLERLFPRGLMLLDFDEHKAHRHIMATAFKTEPMRGYLERLNEEIPSRIKEWGKTGSFAFYPAIKKLSLDMATTVFLGLPADSKDGEAINTALTDMVSASMGIVRVPIPGTIMRKGVKGRAFMVDYLRQEIPKRKKSDANDIFTRLCNAEDDDGNSFTEQEIIDHMIFLWMAAHDTITSSMTTLVYELGRHTDWQQKVRDEIASLGLNEDSLPYEKMKDLVLTEYAFKEALRLNPPVPAIARQTVRDVEYDGFLVPANTQVGISTVATHRNEDVWPNPDAFDPMRFENENVRSRHRFAWVPFGGGAHMCIGLHFAYMQAKAIMTHLLPHFDIILPEGYTTEFQIVPLIKPKDGLPVTIKARD